MCVFVRAVVYSPLAVMTSSSEVRARGWFLWYYDDWIGPVSVWMYSVCCLLAWLGGCWQVEGA